MSGSQASVVEAIEKRNVTCLAKKPIVRDPHIFDSKEAAMGFSQGPVLFQNGETYYNPNANSGPH